MECGSCCDQKYVVVDVSGCRPKDSCSQTKRVFCPDGSFPEHPSFKLFAIDVRFGIFSSLAATEKGKSTINYLLWIYEDDYEEYGYKGIEMLHYHVAHLLYISVVNAATEAQSKQLQASKGTATMRIITETLAEGSSSISVPNSQYYTTPFGRVLNSMKEARQIGFLAL